MASIKKIENKKSIVYRITVCNGYDMYGKKIKHTTSYTPDGSLTPRQQDKSADKFAMEFEENVKNGGCFDGEKLSFEEFAYKWLEYMKDNVSYSTYESYKQQLVNKMIPYFKNYKLGNIKTPLIENFYKTMVDKYAYATIVRCSRILSGIFKTGIRWQMLETNPCSNAIIPKSKREKPKLKYFSPQQSIMFLKSTEIIYEVKYKSHQRVDDTGISYLVNNYTEAKAVPTQYKVFFNIALFCGLRKGEVLALHWSDINFEKREINISKSVAKSESGITYKNPKTYSSVRTVSLPNEILPLLKKYRSEYNQYRLSLGDK